MLAPRWLDRLWLTVIALSFCLILPIWLILSIERMGWIFVTGAIALALVIRYHVARRETASDAATPPAH